MRRFMVDMTLESIICKFPKEIVDFVDVGNYFFGHGDYPDNVFFIGGKRMNIKITLKNDEHSHECDKSME
jgi:hypothetical protein